MVICLLCGRLGTRAFVQSSGNGDGARDSYVCSNSQACLARQQPSRQRLSITATEAAALDRLLDAYLASGDRSDPGLSDLALLRTRVAALYHDHRAYRSPY
jgi:hypothetical protein